MDDLGQLAIIVLAASAPPAGALFGWIGLRMVRAIDRLTDTVQGHALDLAAIKTKLEM